MRLLVSMLCTLKFLNIPALDIQTGKLSFSFAGFLSPLIIFGVLKAGGSIALIPAW